MTISTITRSTWIDDDGSGTTGTIVNNAALQTDVYNRIDALVAAVGGLTIGGPFTTPGTLSERGRTAPVGEWISPGFNAANFSATGGTWTVTAGNLIQYKYTLIGKTITVLVSLGGSTIAGTPSTLQMVLPGLQGLAGGAIYGGCYQCSPGGIWVNATYAFPGAATVNLFPGAAQSGTFPATAGLFYLGFQLTYPI